MKLYTVCSEFWVLSYQCGVVLSELSHGGNWLLSTPSPPNCWLSTSPSSSMLMSGIKVGVVTVGVSGRKFCVGVTGRKCAGSALPVDSAIKVGVVTVGVSGRKFCVGVTGRKCAGSALPVDSAIKEGVVTEGRRSGICWLVVDDGKLGLFLAAMVTLRSSPPPLSEECQLEAESWLSWSSVDIRELSRKGRTWACETGSEVKGSEVKGQSGHTAVVHTVYMHTY